MVNWLLVANAKIIRWLFPQQRNNSEGATYKTSDRLLDSKHCYRINSNVYKDIANLSNMHTNILKFALYNVSEH